MPTIEETLDRLVELVQDGDTEISGERVHQIVDAYLAALTGNKSGYRVELLRRFGDRTARIDAALEPRVGEVMAILDK